MTSILVARRVIETAQNTIQKDHLGTSPESRAVAVEWTSVPPMPKAESTNGLTPRYAPDRVSAQDLGIYGSCRATLERSTRSSLPSRTRNCTRFSLIIRMRQRYPSKDSAMAEIYNEHSSPSRMSHLHGLLGTRPLIQLCWIEKRLMESCPNTKQRREIL